MIDRLMKDITGGGLRRRKAAAEDGLMLDDFDIYDNDEDDLIAIRRAAAAKRRRMLLENGDVMEHLASNPKTAAFAKAAQTVLDEENRVYLSDSEEEVEETQYKSNTALVIEESDEEVEEEDEDDENEASASAAPIVVKENRMEYIEEDESSYIESTIQVQTMTRSHASPLSSHHKPFFRSPGKMDRFKSLLGEGRISFGGSNDTGGARVGFGAPVPKKDKGKEPVRGFVPTKTDKKATKSRLLGVMSSRADSFT
ncbi:hypothetical protein K501DRAFT_281033 [Backusella circina FSU 941]|nr:hypothetical protein K501DRAFT_281033 [Backusella circina FSU 941]